MTNDNIKSLFENNKLLARAMDTPSIRRINGDVVYDFSTWAEEVDMAKNGGLSSLSSTLLVAGENVPTYKSMGFLINSDLTDPFHISEGDSGSHGDIKRGDFFANESDIKSLPELAALVKEKKMKTMNEVNINTDEKSIVGLFVNKALSKRPKAYILMARECYKMQTGKSLPIYIYDNQNGSLTEFNPSKQEKLEFIKEMRDEKQIMSTSIYYDVYSDHTKEEKSANVLDVFLAKSDKFQNQASEIKAKTPTPALLSLLTKKQTNSR